MRATDLVVACDAAGNPSRKFTTPAYRYIRAADRLPSTEAARAMGRQCPVGVKVFNPTGAQTWWIGGYDPSTDIAWGAVDIGYGVEMGDFLMRELASVRGRFGLPLERDLHLPAVTLGRIIDGARP